MLIFYNKKLSQCNTWVWVNSQLYITIKKDAEDFTPYFYRKYIKLKNICIAYEIEINYHSTTKITKNSIFIRLTPQFFNRLSSNFVWVHVSLGPPHFCENYSILPPTANEKIVEQTKVGNFPYIGVWEPPYNLSDRAKIEKKIKLANERFRFS